ncbi:MAG: cupin domain-containing protein [Bacteroidales bacterium]|nr:cupin domain-containing protein [Bacteroidales bacterium]
MKLIEATADFSMASVGAFEKVKGKDFAKDVLNTTSMEVSITALEAGEQSLYHVHRHNEELYVVISGEGVMRIEGVDHAVAEGTVVRVAPKAARCLKNTGGKPLVFMCVQARENSLEGYTLGDGSLAKD